MCIVTKAQVILAWTLCHRTDLLYIYARRDLVSGVVSELMSADEWVIN